MNKGIFALSMGTFALGLTEFLIMGILSVMAADMGVSIAKAGDFITAYASGVCLGAVLMLLFRKMPLRSMVMMLAAVIAVGNIFTACSQNYWMMISSRFISGLPHGAFFGVGAIVARKLAAPGKEVAAVSYMIAGMTVATLAGVPLGTFITNSLSWRCAFAIVSLAGVLTFVFAHKWIPALGALPDHGFKGQFRFLRTLPPWLIFSGVMLSQIGMYCWYSYIDPQLTQVAHFSVDSLSWLMIASGLGMFAGNLIAGRLSLRYKPAAVASSVMMAGVIVLILIYYLFQIQWLAVILMMCGTAVLFGSGSPLQSSIVGYSKGGELLGGACIQIAYNAGNAIAAQIGALVINSGLGYRSVPLPGIPLLALGSLTILILYLKYERK
ncbi:MAG: MFS transporter [Clostridium sp.]|nr:MFS transporter [Clostridium sp.]